MDGGANSCQSNGSKSWFLLWSFFKFSVLGTVPILTSAWVICPNNDSSCCLLLTEKMSKFLNMTSEHDPVPFSISDFLLWLSDGLPAVVQMHPTVSCPCVLGSDCSLCLKCPCLYVWWILTHLSRVHYSLSSLVLPFQLFPIFCQTALSIVNSVLRYYRSTKPLNILVVFCFLLSDCKFLKSERYVVSNFSCFLIV